MGDNMPSTSSSYARTRSLYGYKEESAKPEECFCTFLITDDKILQPAGLLYIDVVAMASLGKLNCHNVSVLASICQEIPWTFSESMGVLLQSPLCSFTLIYLLKHFALICVSLTLNSQVCRRYSWKACATAVGSSHSCESSSDSDPGGNEEQGHESNKSIFMQYYGNLWKSFMTRGSSVLKYLLLAGHTSLLMGLYICSYRSFLHFYHLEPYKRIRYLL